MRIWSLHPKYLDASGLVALWREALLAGKVLSGGTKGYRYHPQLKRFRECPDPIRALHRYLGAVLEEACRRGYSFDPGKIGDQGFNGTITVTKGQVAYEAKHLLGKLERRKSADTGLAGALRIDALEVNPLFVVVEGGVEDWEKRRG